MFQHWRSQEREDDEYDDDEADFGSQSGDDSDGDDEYIKARGDSDVSSSDGEAGPMYWKKNART